MFILVAYTNKLGNVLAVKKWWACRCSMHVLLHANKCGPLLAHIARLGK
jgi:hypothetical protein